MAQPLLTIRDAAVRFGNDTLFDNVSFSIFAGDRHCLVGRNGCGKSTLFKLIVGEREPDAGERFIQQGVSIGYLPQVMDDEPGQNVYDYVLVACRKRNARNMPITALTRYWSRWIFPAS